MLVSPGCLVSAPVVVASSVGGNFQAVIIAVGVLALLVVRNPWLLKNWF